MSIGPKSIRGKVTLAATAATAIAMLFILGITAFAMNQILTGMISNSLDERLDMAQEEVMAGNYQAAIDLAGDEMMQIIDANGNILAETPNARGVGAIVGADDDGDDDDDIFEKRFDRLEFERDDDDDDDDDDRQRIAAALNAPSAGSADNKNGSEQSELGSTANGANGSTGASANNANSGNAGSAARPYSPSNYDDDTDDGDDYDDYDDTDDSNDYDDHDDTDDSNNHDANDDYDAPDASDDYDDSAAEEAREAAEDAAEEAAERAEEERERAEEAAMRSAPAAVAYDAADDDAEDEDVDDTDDDDDDDDDDDEGAAKAKKHMGLLLAPRLAMAASSAVSSATASAAGISAASSASASNTSSATSVASSAVGQQASSVDHAPYIDATEVFGDEGPYLVKKRQVKSPDGTVTLAAVTSLASAAHTARLTTQLLATIFLALLCLVVAFTWNMAARTLQPVEHMRRTAESINASNLSERIPVPARDKDLSRLATTFNELLERVEASFNEQRRFVSDASHELKSPVAATGIMLETLREHPEAVDTSQVVDDLTMENNRLANIVGDLLTLARSDEGRMQVDAKPIDLMDLLLEEAAGLETRKGVSVDTTAVQPVVCNADAELLSHSVRNLLENAARYAKSTVKLSCTADENNVHIMVSDDGCGIAPEDRERVFDRFVSLEDGRSNPDSTGLGLPVARSIAERHGGSLVFVDPELGGATALLSIPIVNA